MCGIAGIVNLTARAPIEPGALPVLASALTHRGPDDQGTYLDPQARCGLAFRRLAIIDLAGGAQPLANEDGTVWVVFNGEIYNFRALRRELEERGHRFRTRTDTEVIVHAYEEHGARCLSRLAGMFAIAIWDARAGTLVLARDRFGKKPLTYAVHAGRLYFASEAKAILALPDVPRRLDPQALHRYLVFQYVPAPHSIYAGFRQLPPGHLLSVRAGQATGGSATPWYVLPQTRFAGSYDDAKQRLGELLTQAVARRLIADVPLGAFLSGGIDSSIVVGLMRRLGVSPLRTFSIGFPESRYDETRFARLVAERFQTEHHEHIVTPQAREILDTLAWHYDEPFADSSAIPTYYVARYTRDFVTVALTGDAGDECFGGYDRYHGLQLAGTCDSLPRSVRRLAAWLGAQIPHSQPKTLAHRAYRFTQALLAAPAERYLAWVNVFPPELVVDGYRPEFRDLLDLDEPRRWFTALFNAADGLPAARAIRTDFASYLPFDLLTKVDLASMACGLECRAPFLDHDLVEFAVSLPLEWRLGGPGGKRILKDWAADLLPRKILGRRKMGFGVPVGTWFRGELQDVLRNRVLAPESLCRRVFRDEWLTHLVEAHVSGRTNFEHPLWALLMLELWYACWRPILPLDVER